jgi:hypothetical protein
MDERPKDEGNRHRRPGADAEVAVVEGAATERALRHGVIWQKTSHGTDGREMTWPSWYDGPRRRGTDRKTLRRSVVPIDLRPRRKADHPQSHFRGS